jgi:dUTP pyrophosphatase
VTHPDNIRIPIAALRPGVALPEYQSAGAAGMDVQAAIDETIELLPGAVRLVPCGFAMAIPAGYEVQVRPRSGLAAKHGVTVLNSPGTIDSDYRGEVKVILINHGPDVFLVTPGMRVAQLVVARVAHASWDVVDSLSETNRGAGGFGHTGA